MFAKSRVSHKGQAIISVIFLLCFIAPEALILGTASRLPDARYVIGMSVVRLVWSVPLYYFTMLGNSLARYISILLMLLGSAFLVGSLTSKTWLTLGLPLAVIAGCIVILLSASSVKARGRYR